MRYSLIAGLISATTVLAIPFTAQLPFLNTPNTHLPSVSTLLSALSVDEVHQLTEHVKSFTEPRLLRWADGHEAWHTEGEKALIIWHEKGRKFVDVTDQPAAVAVSKDKGTFPKKVTYSKKTLQPLYDDITISRMTERLTKFTSFWTRHYTSRTGRDSQAWLLSLVSTLAHSNPGSNVTVSEFPHSWGQNSIIARFEPKEPTDAQTVILGAHQDSTNFLPFLSAPGADDDGSGTVTILEAFTILVEKSWRPDQGAVEFHWYSAEEGGMLGSGQVAKQYQAEGRNIRSMCQYDMTAYVKPGTKERVGIVTDFVDPEMSQFLRTLIDEYLEIPWVDTKCGYACSDHSSWTNIGVPSAFGIEATFEDSNNANIHSSKDRTDVEGFSFTHMAEFSKLSLAYIVEMTGGLKK